MISKNKKELENINNENIILLGLYENNNNHYIFCRVKENPDNIYIVSSKKNDPSHFSEKKEIIIFKNKFLGKKLKLENIDNIISSKIDNKKIITFIYKKGENKHLYWAISKKENIWVIQNSISKIKEIGGVISDYKQEKNYFIYYGESSIYNISSPDFLKTKKNKEPLLKPRPAFFDKEKLKFIASKITEKGILVFYDSSIKDGDKLKIQIGVAMFSLSNPHNIIWRADEPIFEEQVPYQKDFICKGIFFMKNEMTIYWYSKNTGIFTTSLNIPFSSNLTKEKIKILSRHHKNPIISPKIIDGKGWMSECAFNPTAVNIDGNIHILFRAMGIDGISKVGYALLKDGFNVDFIYPEPAFSLRYSHFGFKLGEHKYDRVMYPSGGSWGGCEDSRIVKIDDTIYITFNAFDNWSNIRVGLSSIKESDFVNNIWNWSEPKLISPQGQRHKSWVLFPEKINGKFAILHNLFAIDSNKVVIDYIDNLDSIGPEGLNFVSSDPQKMPNKKITWHHRMRSVGPPPVKTEKGWLVFYHATDLAEPEKYKMGAMLLDLKEPTKIIARSIIPILEPDMWYENDWKPGIIFTCGAIIKDEKIFIYYGGGDKYICIATTPLKEFLENLENNKGIVPFIKKVIFS
ncbi:MAG: hypothetical protein V1910_01570 [bacterium]